MESTDPKLFVWVPQRTPRLRYTLDWVLGQRLGIAYECSEHPPKEDQANYTGVLCYGKPEFLQGLPAFPRPTAILVATDLLFEEGLRPLVLSEQVRTGLFPTEHALGHDPLAGIFWMLSRYEEYQIPIRDAFGRFPASSSLLYRAGVLEEAPADAYVEALGAWLQGQFPAMPGATKTLSLQPGVDIDLCYSYRGKPLLRQVGGVLRELLSGKWGDLMHRLLVLLRQRPDPYDTYAQLESWHAKIALQAQSVSDADPALRIRSLPPLFMLLTGSYNRQDPAHHPRSPYLRRLARYLHLGGAQLGWHPSLRSNRDEKAAKQEIQAWSALAGSAEALDTRQHYLSLEVTRQPARLVSWGVRRDYSMGYAEAPGFRAGTGHLFGWYDLNTESALPLQVHPLTIMDITLHTYLGLEPEAAMLRVEKVLAAYRRYGGYFSLLWHNSSSGQAWRGWEKVYQHVYRYFLPGLDLSSVQSHDESPYLSQGQTANGPLPLSTTSGRWTLRPITEQERQVWDEALPDWASVVHRLAYLDARWASGWQVLVSPDGQWLWPTAHRRGLRGYLDRRLRRLAQPLLIQKMSLLPVPTPKTPPGPQTPRPPGPDRYGSLVREWDLRYRSVDMHWDIPAQDPAYALILPNPRWTFGRQANAVIPLAKSLEAQRQAYHAHHRRYLRPNQGMLRSLTWEEARSMTSWQEGLCQMLSTKAGWGSARLAETQDLVQTMVSEGRALVWAWVLKGDKPGGTMGDKPGDEVGAGAVLWISGSTLVYALGFDTAKGRKQRSTLQMVDALLAWALDQKDPNGQARYLALDMEGSESPGLMRFYTGFGAKVEVYGRVIKKA